MNIEERTRVEETLRQIDDLVAALGHIADPAAREAARKLVEAVLDLHGLALARIMTIVAAEGGRAVSEKLAADEQVKAVLLLYGLHPEDAATRVRRAVEAIRPRLTAAGIGIVLGRVSAGAVTVRVFGSDTSDSLLREIEEVIGDAAPDLDEIVLEWSDDTDVPAPAALAG